MQNQPGPSTASAKMPAEVKVSHDLELELPKDVMELARKQGENADVVCSLIQELKDMIYGKYFVGKTCSKINKFLSINKSTKLSLLLMQLKALR